MLGRHMRELFAMDAQRFERFSLRFQDLLVDYSKNRIVPETMPLLLNLAREAQVESWRDLARPMLGTGSDVATGQRNENRNDQLSA